MTKKRLSSGLRALVLVAAIMGCQGQVATPLPTPPSAAPSHMTLTEAQPGSVALEGEPMALLFDPGTRLRVTGPSGFVETVPGTDGSFTVSLVGTRAETYYLEALLVDDDAFLLAVTGGAGTRARETAPGPDGDSDASPDAVDCAPADETVGGRRCVATPGVEICNGLDDDGDLLVDEGCASACASDVDCGAGESCTAGACGGDPAAGEVCGNGLDDDGDGLVDEECGAACDVARCDAGLVCVDGGCLPDPGGGDTDGDGFGAGSDCDDADPGVHPAAVESCNGLDDDCDSVVDEGC